MPRYATSRNNFLGGELSGRSDGRTDLPQYNLGGKQIRNFIVMPDGGVTKRPGTRFVEKVAGQPTNVRLIPFLFSKTEYYVVMIWTEANVNYFRVIDGVTLAPQTVAVDGSFPPADLTGLLNGIQYAQSADVMFLATSGVAPFTIYRTGNPGAYTFNVSRYVDGTQIPGLNNSYLRNPYMDENPTGGATITPSATTGTITLTASFGIFTSQSVGSRYRIGPAGTGGYARVTVFTSATVVTAVVEATLPGTGATTNWAESAWSPRRGWPAAITFYNQRLAFGGSKSQPDTFWLSQVGDYYELYSQGSTALTAAQNYTLSDGKVDNIQWMVGGKKLTIGTVGGETVGVVQEDGTNLNIQFNQETAHGSSYIQPQRVAAAIPFVQASGHRIREIIFDFGSDQYVANDLTLLRNDVAEGYWNNFFDENKIKQIAYQEAPYPVLWLIDDAGFLYGITRERQQQVSAWHTHLIGGKISEMTITGLNGADHQAMAMSLCVTPDAFDAGDRLWLIVNRDVNGQSVFFLEYVDRFRYMDRYVFAGNTGEGWFYFLDAAKGVYSNSPVNVFSGFTHLANEQVTAMLDGKSVGTVTVANDGTVTIPNGLTGRACVVGYPYVSRLKTSRTEGGSNIGSSNGAIRRVDQIRINMFKSRFWKFGFERSYPLRYEFLNQNLATQYDVHDAKLESHRHIDPQEIIGEPFFAASGIVTKAAPAEYDDKAVAIIVSDEPYPCTVLGITVRAVEADV